MPTYEAGLFKNKNYDSILDANNDETLEDRMYCFIAGKAYYKYDGVLQEIKMEVHTGVYSDLTTIGSAEIANPIAGVPYLFYDPEANTNYLMIGTAGAAFSPVKFWGEYLLTDESVDSRQLKDNSIWTRHILDQNITTEKYAFDSIVGTAHIKDGSIYLEQMGSQSVGAGQYVPQSISSLHIKNGEVKGINIETGAVTNSKIVSVGAEKITGQLPVSSIDYTFEQSLSDWSSFVSDDTDISIPSLNSKKTMTCLYIEVRNDQDVSNSISLSVNGMTMNFRYDSFTSGENACFTFPLPLVSDGTQTISVSSTASNFYRYRYSRQTVLG